MPACDVMWRHKAITWTNVDWSSEVFCGSPDENFTRNADDITHLNMLQIARLNYRHIPQRAKN